MARAASSSATREGLGNNERSDDMVEFKGKLVLALGERDGIPASALEACAKSAGAEIIFADTQCFV